MYTYTRPDLSPYGDSKTECRNEILHERVKCTVRVETIAKLTAEVSHCKPVLQNICHVNKFVTNFGNQFCHQFCQQIVKEFGQIRPISTKSGPILAQGDRSQTNLGCCVLFCCLVVFELLFL